MLSVDSKITKLILYTLQCKCICRLKDGVQNATFDHCCDCGDHLDGGYSYMLRSTPATGRSNW